jgi:hypothetical protein
MSRRQTTGMIATLAGVALMGGMFGVSVLAQRVTPADVATKISGNWKMNLELSPQFRPAGGGRQGAPGAMLAPAGQSRATLALQRGGGGGGAQAAPPDPRVTTGNRALQALQQVPDTMTIAATAESVTFTDPRGTRTYAVDNKNIKQDLGNEAEMTLKSRWDNRTLRQEFIFDETKVTHAFEVNNEGTRITFTMRVDNFSGGVGRQARAVYDKVQ